MKSKNGTILTNTLGDTRHLPQASVATPKMTPLHTKGAPVNCFEISLKYDFKIWKVVIPESPCESQILGENY
jgi:hypothetical protein